jgi:carbon-monoxide dehydrogenase large subunit
VKGAGEGGTIPGISCIVSAVEDALKSLGVKINEYPISPERLLQLIDEAKSSPPPLRGRVRVGVEK